jgi:DNA processing protein
MLMDRARKDSRGHAGARLKYSPPRDTRSIQLPELLRTSGRPALADKQLSLLRAEDAAGVELFFSGDLSLIDRPCVAIVGSRSVSDAGRARASRLARELVQSGLVVVSGLALGIDTAAHTAAIAAGGSTIAVVGTPLDRAYPAENIALQEEIYRDHLLVSPFRKGERTYRSSFPKRNRVMAAITDATVIVEASDTSGSLHQAAECVRLGRWLFIAKSLADDPTLAWPAKFLRKGGKTDVLTSTTDLVRAIERERQ